MRLSPVRGINLIPYTVCKSRLCRRILSGLRADLRENPTKQWASRDTLVQSAGSISNSVRYHSDANIALGPILKMYIPGQIRISNALNNDGYSTGNAPPSGNNGICDISINAYVIIFINYAILCTITCHPHIITSHGQSPYVPAVGSSTSFNCYVTTTLVAV